MIRSKMHELSIMETQILLFDLNGTLCHRVKDQGLVMFRPHIVELEKLSRFYRIGVYSSVMEHNAKSIVERIESECNTHQLFDRTLLFSQKHTVPFTPKEVERYQLSPYKRKKRLSRIFGPAELPRVRIIDDEPIRVVEKRHVITIRTWSGDPEDKELLYLVHRLLARAKRPPSRRLLDARSPKQ